MSWATRRQMIYLFSVTLFLLVVIGGPLAYSYFSQPATCADGIMNQGETAIDKGGPCLVLDERLLQPHATLWARAFKVRDGLYNVVAYVENPNKDAGAPVAHYKFSLYDDQNILIAERTGTTFIMPGGVTPILEAQVDTGNRIVAHTYFEFVGPITWERMYDPASAVLINDKKITDVTGTPRVTASAENTAVADLPNPLFVVVLFDPQGNAFAASQTAVSDLPANTSLPLTFTWPQPFAQSVSRIDILPVVNPLPAPTQ